MISKCVFETQSDAAKPIPATKTLYLFAIEGCKLILSLKRKGAQSLANLSKSLSCPQQCKIR